MNPSTHTFLKPTSQSQSPTLLPITTLPQPCPLSSICHTYPYCFVTDPLTTILNPVYSTSPCFPTPPTSYLLTTHTLSFTLLTETLYQPTPFLYPPLPVTLPRYYLLTPCHNQLCASPQITLTLSLTLH